MVRNILKEIRMKEFMIKQKEMADILRKLYNDRKDELKKHGLDISCKELFGFYKV